MHNHLNELATLQTELLVCATSMNAICSKFRSKGFASQRQRSMLKCSLKMEMEKFCESTTEQKATIK